MAGAQPHHCQCQQHLQEPLQLLPQRSTALISIDEDEPLIVVADSGDILQIDLSEYDPRSTVPPIAIAPITIPSAPLAGPIKTEKPSGSL